MGAEELERAKSFKRWMRRLFLLRPKTEREKQLELVRKRVIRVVK